MLSAIAIERGLNLGKNGRLAVEKYLSSTIQKGEILVGKASKGYQS